VLKDIASQFIKNLINFVSKFDGGNSRTKIIDYYSRIKSALPKDTYSQFGEDAVLSFFLPEKHGRYLDIGAGHFRNGSNTYVFYKRGWRGICVEPIPILYELLRKKRPEDKVVQKVVSNIQTKVEFFEYEPYEYSTTDPETMKKLASIGMTPVRRLEFESISINDLSLNVVPTQPYFLTIDCEGLDVEIMKSINFRQFCPRVICCEIYPADLEGRRELETFLRDKNYRLMAICVFSLIFVHDDYLKAQKWSRYI
jgi:FkbM family methyltransferase